MGSQERARVAPGSEDGSVTNLSPIVAELERLYGVLRDNVFEDASNPDAFKGSALSALNDQPVISVASRGRKRTVNGWYVPAVWSDVTDDLLDAIVGTDDGATLTRRAEIVVSSEVLREDALRIAVELCRGMATHIVHRIGDSIPVGPNYWHTSSWRNYAAAFGCVATVNPEQPSKGWSVLTPTPAFVATVTPLLNPDVFDISRDADATVTDDRRSGMSVYRCKCPTRLRSAVMVVARCVKCGEVFTYADNRRIPERVADPARKAIAQGGPIAATIGAVYGTALARDDVPAETE